MKHISKYWVAIIVLNAFNAYYLDSKGYLICSGFGIGFALAAIYGEMRVRSLRELSTAMRKVDEEYICYLKTEIALLEGKAVHCDL